MSDPMAVTDGDWRERLRLRTEKAMLSVRIRRLEMFITTDQFSVLHGVDQADLRAQLAHMRDYHAVLSRRVQRHCGDEA